MPIYLRERKIQSPKSWRVSALNSMAPGRQNVGVTYKSTKKQTYRLVVWLCGTACAELMWGSEINRQYPKTERINKLRCVLVHFLSLC